MGRAVFNGFRKLLCSSKLYITAVILFSCIYTGFGGINGYLMRQGQTVQAGELFVFGMDSWIPQLIITVAFLILVNDIPFGKSGAQLQLIRSSRSRWLLGQTLSGFSTAAVYLILVELLFVVTTVRNLSFSDEWSLDGVRLSLVEFFVVSVESTVAAFLFEHLVGRRTLHAPQAGLFAQRPVGKRQ